MTVFWRLQNSGEEDIAFSSLVCNLRVGIYNLGGIGSAGGLSPPARKMLVCVFNFCVFPFGQTVFNVWPFSNL